MKSITQLAPAIDERAERVHIGRGASYSESMAVIAPRIYERIMYYVQAARGEIGGFARVEWVKRRIPGVSEGRARTTDFHVVDACILPQYASGGYCHIDENAMSAWISGMHKRDEDASAWSCWWHSHNDFAAFMSGTDHATLKSLSANTPIIGICFNRYGQMHAEYHSGAYGQEIAATVRPLDVTSAERTVCARQVRRMVRRWNPPAIKWEDAPATPAPDKEAAALVPINYGIADADYYGAYGDIPAWERAMIADYEHKHVTQETPAHDTDRAAADRPETPETDGFYAPSRFDTRGRAEKTWRDAHRKWSRRKFRGFGNW